MAGFKMGRMVMTAGVSDRMDRDTEFAKHVVGSLKRYTKCDWGDLSAEDAEMNNEALLNNDDRILAAYEMPGNPDGKIWIITEWDRSATTILFPDEY